MYQGRCGQFRTGLSLMMVDLCNLMNPVKKIIVAVCMAGCAIKASCSDGQNNPYKDISERNPFELNPAAITNSDDVITPPVQITLNGIMTIFGDKRALLKTQPAISSLGATKGKNYMLAEGQRDGEIELLAVDVTGEKIKVNNHGVIQIISLSKTPELPILKTFIAGNSAF